MVIGDAAQWDDFFPGHLLPRILDLVTETWERFEKPQQDALEPAITKRFRSALKQAKDYKGLPFFIMREDVEDDFEAGEEVGRKDLAFYPTGGSSREEVYFAFECKRLNALVGGRVRALASEYVTEGMARFVTGQYARFMGQGGMIGYVLDSQCERAIGLVENNIRIRHSELRMDPPGVLAESSLWPENPLIRQSEHKLPRLFRMHHIFLACAPQGFDMPSAATG
jgi:hypothetical protein